MRTILISGTAQIKPYRVSNITTGFKVQYNVWIWAAKDNEPIQLVNTSDVLLCGHGELWTMAKGIAQEYFNDDKFQDGAYTQYLEHLINSMDETSNKFYKAELHKDNQQNYKMGLITTEEYFEKAKQINNS